MSNNFKKKKKKKKSMKKSTMARKRASPTAPMAAPRTMPLPSID